MAQYYTPGHGEPAKAPPVRGRRARGCRSGVRRLEALVGRCTDADLARPLPAGWTMAAVLAHLPPRRAAELAVSIARAADRVVETLWEEMLGRNAAAGAPLNVVRAEHRREDLDEIERALGRRAT